MHSQRLKISIFFLIAFLLFIGAKPQKKVQKPKKAKKVVLTPFQKLKKEYLVYKNSPKNNKDFEVLKGYIAKFEKFNNSQKDDEKIQSNYYIADANEKLFELTKNNEYLEKAYEIYLRLSKYLDSYGLASQKKVELLKAKVNKNEPQSTNNQDISENKRLKLLNITHSTYDTFSQVFIELDGVATYEHRHLKADFDNSKPDRVVIDIKNATYSDTKFLEPIILQDNVFDKIRVGQYTQDILRVVLDLKEFSRYETSLKNNPLGIVVNVYGKNSKSSSAVSEFKLNADKFENISTKEVSNNIKLPVKLIVIDMGHGAQDPGAIGYKGLKEKDVVLDIGLKLGEIIKKNFPQIDVLHTRKDDTFLKLEERANIANAKKADLFISIHANASRNKEARGIETYFLNFAKEERAKEVVARENASSIEGVDEVQEILKDLIVSSKYNESSMLAAMIQKSLVNRIKLDYSDVIDLGVKQGPFYVLLGAAMPSVLVETAFISNPTEAMRLADDNYRYKVAEGIFEGIKEYILKANFASLKK